MTTQDTQGSLGTDARPPAEHVDEACLNGSHKIVLRHVRQQFVLRVEGLFTETIIPSTDVFAGISFCVRENEFVSIVGPSGCGKTTLLRIAGGLISPTSGSIEIDREPVRGARKDVAFVFQNACLLPWRSVLSNVALGKQLRLHRALRADERADLRRWLDLVGLAGTEDLFPHALSGGMMQRVGLARALSTEPSVLLMDEPFGALDAQTRVVLQHELLKIHSAYHATVLFVTHDIEEALYLSDRVLVMAGQPARIARTIEVPFPRHARLEARSTQEFARLKAEIWSLLGIDHSAARESVTGVGEAHHP